MLKEVVRGRLGPDDGDLVEFLINAFNGLPLVDILLAAV